MKRTCLYIHVHLQKRIKFIVLPIRIVKLHKVRKVAQRNYAVHVTGPRQYHTSNPLWQQIMEGRQEALTISLDKHLLAIVGVVVHPRQRLVRLRKDPGRMRANPKPRTRICASLHNSHSGRSISSGNLASRRLQLEMREDFPRVPLSA